MIPVELRSTSAADSFTVPCPYTLTPRITCDPNGVWHVRGYVEARELLLLDIAQAGFQAENVTRSGLDPVLYQRGETHRQQRAAIAKFFSPTTTHQKHLGMIERLADEIVGTLTKAKRADLNDLSVQMAASVAATVVGLKPTRGLTRRLDAMLHSSPHQRRFGGPVGDMLRGGLGRLSFWFFDVRPAIARRRRRPEDDVISYMLSKGSGKVAILAECVVYGAAGMATTQEFISVVLWHCLQRPELKELMLTGERDRRYEFLHEVLRIEPVIGTLKRRTLQDTPIMSDGQRHTIPAGALIVFHVYDINVDGRVLGGEPWRLKARRDVERSVSRSLVSFGAGPHRCAGEFIALAETDVFVRRLLALPGIRIESGPALSRNELVDGYELRGTTIAVD